MSLQSPDPPTPVPDPEESFDSSMTEVLANPLDDFSLIPDDSVAPVVAAPSTPVSDVHRDLEEVLASNNLRAVCSSSGSGGSFASE